MREIIKLIVAVLLTLIIEFLVIYLEKVRDKRLWYSLLFNVLTNLLLNSLLSLIPILWVYIVCLIVGEILVFLIEWGLYHLVKKDKKNWWISLSANLASFIIGTSIMYLLFVVIFI